MTFDGLLPATLKKRYKRFLADVELADGTALTVHCPNTGAMTGCAEPGSRVWLSVSQAKTRKYPHTWELVETPRGMACIHSALANTVVAEALAQQRIAPLAGYTDIQREVAYAEGSRADFRLRRSGRPDCTVEVKSVTLCDANGVGLFPDAVSVRARRHLEALQALARAGERAVILFCVFHEGIRCVQPADHIDPAYGEALRSAETAGVEPLAWRARVSTGGITLEEPLPVLTAGDGVTAC
ncbi:MAG: DNA/RNA nuclease SfsA [Halieaceae bacterium]|jgi:sugar fermentation stimulation protein A|nr:DNA/RNA nuclease SfsA [Halieaceae bacterium]